MTLSPRGMLLLRVSLPVACIALYLAGVIVFGLGNPFVFFGATQLRAFLPSLAVFLLLSDLTRFVRVTDGEVVPQIPPAAVRPDPPSARPERPAAGSPAPKAELPAESPAASVDVIAPDSPEAQLGRFLYSEARSLVHQEVPDFESDNDYLALLGKSAEAGYCRAYAKLGDYAMRRNAWVEAFYWMCKARLSGMVNLSPVLDEISTNWLMAGSPDESENVHPLFSEESGSVGRALLEVATGRDVDAAWDYLSSHHPEFLAFFSCQTPPKCDKIAT